MNHIVTPPQVLGMMGGGQLGRMFCHAAQQLGYEVAVLEPVASSPAASVAQHAIESAYDDRQGLDRLLALSQVVTTEFENVPADSLRYLAHHAPVHPCADAVAIVQNRIAEKDFIAGLGIPVAPYAAIRSVQDIEQAPATLFPGILKVARMGYDGKGQQRVASREEALLAFTQFDAVPCVLEALLPLHQEVSVVLGRHASGQMAHYPVAVNQHVNGILSSTAVGLHALPERLTVAAVDAATRIAEGLHYVGVLCVEFFVLQNGQLVVNEIAPRPHNSGHYTMNACVCSQFEQQVRIVAGLPLGSTQLLRPVLMLNILGDIWWPEGADAPVEPAWAQLLNEPGVHLHLYGKHQPRKGRKMGHINIVHEDPAQLLAIAHQVDTLLGLKAAF